MTKDAFWMISVAAIGVAFLLAMRLSANWARGALASNRQMWPDFEKSGRLPSPVLHWLIAHVRDDMAGIWTMLVITNGLLAAILAAVTASLFR
jgi:hypothetical protein